MKVKFKIGINHCIVKEFSSDKGTMEDVIRLVNDTSVLSLSFVRQTPKQYLTKCINVDKETENEI